MISACTLSLPAPFPLSEGRLLTPLQQTTGQVFKQAAQNASFGAHLRPLCCSPMQVLEGIVWGGFWGLSAYFAAESLYDLYRTCTIEHPASEKFTKIATAVKNALVDLASLVSSTGYMAV